MEIILLFILDGKVIGSFRCGNKDIQHEIYSHWKVAVNFAFQIKYTQGDMEVARKYFGQAIKLNSNNMRALFGYYLVCGGQT